MIKNDKLTAYGWRCFSAVEGGDGDIAEFDALDPPLQ
jgi:hypothetical protein